MSEKIQSELMELLSALGFAAATPGHAAQDVLLADLDADSLGLMDLCVALEERYDFTIEPVEVMKQVTLGNLARFIDEKRPKTPSQSA